MKMRIMFTPAEHIQATLCGETETRNGGRFGIKACEAEKKWFRRFFSRGYFYLIQTCRRKGIFEVRRGEGCGAWKWRKFVISSIKRATRETIKSESRVKRDSLEEGSPAN